MEMKGRVAAYGVGVGAVSAAVEVGAAISGGDGDTKGATRGRRRR